MVYVIQLKIAMYAHEHKNIHNEENCQPVKTDKIDSDDRLHEDIKNSCYKSIPYVQNLETWKMQEDPYRTCEDEHYMRWKYSGWD